jgi:uncharacterized protein (DUF4415 family)
MKRSGKTAKARKSSRDSKARRTGKLRSNSKMPEEQLAEMYRPLKKPVTLRLDADVLAWFKKRGSGYQTRINHALRGIMKAEKKKNS